MGPLNPWNGNKWRREEGPPQTQKDGKAGERGGKGKLKPHHAAMPTKKQG